MKYSFSSPEGITITPTSGEAAKVTAAESDRDPRDFLVDVNLGDSAEPVEISVTYFACDDDDRWCKSLTQKFKISWETDRDAGKTQDRSKGAKGGKGNRDGMKGKSERRAPNPEQLMTRLDSNSDGLIQKEEAHGQMIERFQQMDEDSSGTLSKEELSAWFEKRGR